MIEQSTIWHIWKKEQTYKYKPNYKPNLWYLAFKIEVVYEKKNQRFFFTFDDNNSRFILNLIFRLIILKKKYIELVELCF